MMEACVESVSILKLFFFLHMSPVERAGTDLTHCKSTVFI